ncbi:MAG: GNAT family N-acetyltransferase, partial [Acidimicrobiia bacterium]|nr:GNAT family N-acetyltransferase [Acidimicrobiia bacterium]
HPDSRRAGYGRAISETMLAWGYEQGSALAYLQVLATNEPAVDMYRSMGFGEAYRYWYRDR